MFENAAGASDAMRPEAPDESRVALHRGFLEAVTVIKTGEKRDRKRLAATTPACSEMECLNFFLSMSICAFEAEPVLSAFLRGRVGCGLSGCD